MLFYNKITIMDKIKKVKETIDLRVRIDGIRKEGEEERRQIRRSLNRKLLEVKMLTIGNKKDIDILFKRTSDNKEDIEQLQGYVHWIVKLVAGIIVTVITTAVLDYFFNII